MDTTKNYITRSGKRVVIHEVVEKNSAGETVTFPVKGSVIECEPKSPRLRTRFQIWTKDGRADVLRPHADDLINL